eukprot:9227892-Alexandrium_andersonii.AAC.1
MSASLVGSEMCIRDSRLLASAAYCLYAFVAFQARCVRAARAGVGRGRAKRIGHVGACDGGCWSQQQRR